MGRRKKQPPEIHRQQMASAAQTLFAAHGIAQVTMDDIAKAAKYSKATLYVYFASKEELLLYLTYQSMEMLLKSIEKAMVTEGLRARYFAICYAVADYQAEYPFYFDIALKEIKINTVNPTEMQQKTYMVGEQINDKIKMFLEQGIAEKSIRRDLEIYPTIFFLWASISGIILLARQKAKYIEQTMGLSVDSFLQKNFALLYDAIAMKEVIQK